MERKYRYFVVKKRNKYYLYEDDFELLDDNTYIEYRLGKDNKVYKITEYEKKMVGYCGLETFTKTQKIKEYIGKLIEKSNDDEYLIKKYKIGEKMRTEKEILKDFKEELGYIVITRKSGVLYIQSSNLIIEINTNKKTYEKYNILGHESCAFTKEEHSLIHELFINYCILPY